MRNAQGSWRARFLRPKLFLAGVCAGLLLCSLIGRQISRENHYRGFVRPGGAHEMDPGFFLTASQVKAMIESQCRKDQVLVLVGGSSVLFGAGQPIRYLWTKVLNRKLGPNYCVVNLALPAGGLAGFASVALEMTANEYPRKILVSDSTIPPVDADGMAWYKFFFWDAYYKNLLNHSIIKHTAYRYAAIRHSHSLAPPKARADIEQARLGMWLDSYLYFNDLWTFFHYRFHETRYYAGFGAWQWKPRSEGRDYDYEVDENQLRSLKRYPPLNSPAFAGELQAAESYYTQYFGIGPDGRATIKESVLKRGEDAIRAYPNTEFSNITLITLIGQSPYYLKRISPTAVADLRILMRRLAQSWQKFGYHAVVLENVEEADYGDRVHIDTFGGYKLADIVARELRSIFESTHP